MVEHQEVLCWLGQHEARSIPLHPPMRTEHKQPVSVYTLTVEGPEHNFFAEGILVHNKSPMLECWAFEQASTSYDFGEVILNSSASQTVLVSVLDIDGCDWLDEDERQLEFTLDAPSGTFTMASSSVDLVTVAGGELEIPVVFTPTMAQDYEAQILFKISENPEIAKLPPKAVQLFGKGKNAE